MAEIKIKLERDQARAIQQYFHPYLVQLCDTRVKDCFGDIDATLNARAMQSLFLQVAKIIDKRLLTQAMEFNLAFTYAESLAYYTILMQLPILSNQVYLVNLRQLVCDTIHNQLIEP